MTNTAETENMMLTTSTKKKLSRIGLVKMRSAYLATKVMI